MTRAFVSYLYITIRVVEGKRIKFCNHLKWFAVSPVEIILLNT